MATLSKLGKQISFTYHTDPVFVFCQNVISPGEWFVYNSCTITVCLVNLRLFYHVLPILCRTVGIWHSPSVLDEIPHRKSDRFLLVKHHDIDHRIVRIINATRSVHQTIIERKHKLFAWMLNDVECLATVFIRQMGDTVTCDGPGFKASQLLPPNGIMPPPFCIWQSNHIIPPE